MEMDMRKTRHLVVGHSGGALLMEDAAMLHHRRPATTTSRSPSSSALWGRAVRDAEPFSERLQEIKEYMTKKNLKIFCIAGQRGDSRCRLDFVKLYSELASAT